MHTDIALTIDTAIDSGNHILQRAKLELAAILRLQREVLLDKRMVDVSATVELSADWSLICSLGAAALAYASSAVLRSFTYAWWCLLSCSSIILQKICSSRALCAHAVSTCRLGRERERTHVIGLVKLGEGVHAACSQGGCCRGNDTRSGACDTSSASSRAGECHEDRHRGES